MARRPDLVLINTTKKFSGFCCSRRAQSERKRKRKERKLPGYCQRAGKAVEHEEDGDANCSWSSWNGLKRFGRKD